MTSAGRMATQFTQLVHLAITCTSLHISVQEQHRNLVLAPNDRVGSRRLTFIAHTHARVTPYACVRCLPRMGRAAQMSGVTRLVGVQRTVQKQDNVKSEPKYLTFEESPIRAFYFWILTCSPVALLPSTVGWLLRFAESPAVSSVQHSFMHLALQLRTLRRASRALHPVLRDPSPRNVAQASSCVYWMDLHHGQTHR